MKGLITATLVALPFSVPSATAHTAAEESLNRQLVSENHSVAVQALDQVLKTSEIVSADILYIACNVALREKRLEDAGFLWQIAPVRVRFDVLLFPPTESGANDPTLAFSEVRQQVGPFLNPELMAKPAVYAKVLDRVKSWKPKAAADYSPWWEYSKKENEKQVVAVIEEDLKKNIDRMSGLSKLLRDAQYFAAFKTAQDYNLKLTSDTNRPSQITYDAAVQTMERIEKEKGVDDGPSSVIKKSGSDVRPNNNASKPGAQKSR